MKSCGFETKIFHSFLIYFNFSFNHRISYFLCELLQNVALQFSAKNLSVSIFNLFELY